MRTISSILAQKYALIFVLEHYQATFLENWPFLGRNLTAMDKYHCTTKNTFPQKVIEGTDDP